jgi:hypothetical protein
MSIGSVSAGACPAPAGRTRWVILGPLFWNQGDRGEGYESVFLPVAESLA